MRRLTIVLMLLVLVAGCLTPRQEWRHQRYDVLPSVHRQIDEAYLNDSIDEAAYQDLLRLGNLYREAIVSWGRVLIADGNPATQQAEALRLLALIKAELEKDIEQ